MEPLQRFLDTLSIFPHLKVKIKDDYTTNQIFTNFSVLYNDRINLFSFFSILILNLRAFNIKVCLLVESVPLPLPYRSTETVFSQEYSVMGPTPAHHRNKQTVRFLEKDSLNKQWSGKSSNRRVQFISSVTLKNFIKDKNKDGL